MANRIHKQNSEANLAARYGTPLEQMEHLKNALGESVYQPEEDSFLPEDIVTSARRMLLQLQVQNRHCREALQTLQLMEAKGDEEGAALFRELRDQLTAFRATDEPYEVDGRLDEGGSWRIGLFKDSFYLDELAGVVEEVKLRCQSNFVFFTFDPETQYDVSGRDGECSLQVVGDPDTTFTLVQQ